MLMMSPLGASRSAGSPTCCENCVCGEACPGCPSYTGASAMRFAPRRGMMARRGFAGVTDTIKAHPLLIALGLAATAAGVFAYKKLR